MTGTDAWLAAVATADLRVTAVQYVAAVLADLADGHEIDPAPTVSALARVTGCTRLEVRRALSCLIAAGLLAAGSPLRLTCPRSTPIPTAEIEGTLR